MMRKLLLTGIVASMMFTISSCDEDTSSIGNSLTSNVDLFTIVADTFDVTSRSMTAPAVLSRSTYGYLGRIKDPETGAYITSDYMTQFATLENAIDSLFYPQDSVLSVNKDGEVIADSCVITLILNNYVGDSLAAMKMTMYELDHPIEEGKTYYTDFNPETEGYIRTDNGLKKNMVYSIANLQQNDSARLANANNLSVRIKLDKPYTDKNGKEYDNYGTYLMRTYYEHPEYFKNSNTFTNNVCPGFYFKTTDGVGMMAEIDIARLAVYYKFTKKGETYFNYTLFYGTEEVLQTTHISNDQALIDKMAEETEWTYLKTPAGIFTEVTLPVDDIKRNHENDTITSAKITFHKMNDKTDLAEKLLKDPTTLLMVEKDSLATFFENRKKPDNLSTYLATLSTSYNSYTFNNISSLINRLYAKKQDGGANYADEHPDWNKVVLVPVQTVTTTSSSYYSSTSITAINNEMSITSSRLVGGPDNQHAPIRISVIYNKNE